MGWALACGLACAACAGDDSSGASTASEAGTAIAPDAAGRPPDGGDALAAAPLLDGGRATGTFSRDPIDLGEAGCGAGAVTKSLSILAGGDVPLAVAATTTGSAFSVTPSSLLLADGGAGVLTVSAVVPGTATARATMTGSLNLFTNDPAGASVAIPLAVTPTGATLAFPPDAPTLVSFPTTEIGTAAAPVQFAVVNSGNVAGTFVFGAPIPALFSLPLAANTYPLEPGASLLLSAGFTPATSALATATSTVTATGPLCGQSLSSISFTGQGTVGQVTGYPTAAIDFGPVPCGGGAPAPRSFALTNSGLVTAHITVASLTGAHGFTTSAAKGRYILPGGGVLSINVSAPAVPAASALTPVTATLTIQTDADPAPRTITLVEEPTGAVLGFAAAGSGLGPGFGDFGSVVLLGSAAQTFGVTNTGNAPADVVLDIAPATPDAGSVEPGPFSLANARFSVAANGAETDSVVFAPTSATVSTGALSLTTASPVCAALPASLPLSGVGSGGGPSVFPASLSFAATCGGSAPAPQTFTVRNDGSANMTWALSAPSGPGAAGYAVLAGTPPGLLLPGASSIVTVTAASVPSPAPAPDPQAHAAILTITTDVPFDPPHVVSLGETPLGDQLSFGATSLRFGQVPIGTSLSQTLTLSNQANPGSPAAAFALAIAGSGAAAYGAAPSSASNVAAGGGTSAPMTVAFAPTLPAPYPATIALTTTDAICTPLPTPLPITGTGTQAQISVSTTALTFGSDAADPLGLVDCGATGQARSFTVTNLGNQAASITGLSLGKGAASPYLISGASPPALLPIGGGLTLTVTPKAIPADVADPNDAALFADTLTLTTDAALDSPHQVSLVMQARGAVIAATPLSTTWSFGTVGVGSIGTITTALKNTGNAGASVNLQGLAQPAIFGLRGAPLSLAPDGTSAVVGQFVPPSASGFWSDQATLTIDGEAFCAPLPPAWNNPLVTLSGASDASPAITIAGSFVFPTSDCGGGIPSGQAVTLTNATNVAYPYTLALQSGAFYSVTDPGPGTIAPRGTVSVVVTPHAVVPGPGVQPGYAPYEDDLLVKVATSPASSYVVPISWTLNGAVLSLPQGGGPRSDAAGVPYYPADGSGGLTLPFQNGGTATATVGLQVQPSGALLVAPATPIAVIPGIATAPALLATASDAVCGDASAATPATVTFFYSGPVCQPLNLSSIHVRACAGVFP